MTMTTAAATYHPAECKQVLAEKLSSLSNEVRGVRDAVQGIGGIGLFLLFITFALIVQAICLCVLASDIHYALPPNL